MIVAFAGRRIDGKNSDHPRFPAAKVELVAENIRQYFVDNAVSCLVSAAASGADMIALEIAKELNIERQVVLPLNIKEFRKRSVTNPDPEWGKRYDVIIQDLQRTNHVMVFNFEEPDNIPFKKCNTEILNKAESIYKDRALHGQHGSLGALIVWDGKRKSGDDITFDFIRKSKERNINVDYLRGLY